MITMRTRDCAKYYLMTELAEIEKENELLDIYDANGIDSLYG